MKHCGNCNKNFPDDMNFCTECGGKLVEIPEVAVPPKFEGVSTGAADSKPAETTVPDGEKPKKRGGKILKRVIIAVVVIIAILFLWGRHIINSTTYMTFNVQGLLFSKGGENAEVNIDYDGYIWEVSYKPSWVNIEEHESSFVVECEPNTTGADREDHITITSGKVVMALPVGQYGAARYLRLSESSLAFDTDGGSARVDIETDGSSQDISYPDFCRLEDMEDGGFTLVVDENEGYTRSGRVNVSEDNVGASIYISQEGTCPDCDGRGEKSCYSCGGSGSIGWGLYSSACYACGGNGSIRCSSCGGDGVR